ncbi:cache domain-containing protein [Desulfobacterales bacterium HSG16]|nr:cache domain-containing protein [Desulfobacterales bacterium HSG16]
MHRISKFFLTFALIAMIHFTAYANNKVGYNEVQKKVQAAAAYLSEQGEKGLEQFNVDGSPWVFGDTYVFVLNCAEDEMAAHLDKWLIHYKLSDILDEYENYLALELCAAARKPKGWWVEYWWPRPGKTKAMRKISYVLKVPGQPYEVVAGIYNSDKTVEELNEMIK